LIATTQFQLLNMVSKGLAGAAALAFSFASVGAFAPGRTFVKAPLSPSSYGITQPVNVDGAMAASSQMSSVRLT
jgi:hypothetical protein